MQFFDSNDHSVSLSDLPKLVVLTGLNGSGKTRGLKEMQATDPIGAQYIDYQNFIARWDAPTLADISEMNRADVQIFGCSIDSWGGVYPSNHYTAPFPVQPAKFIDSWDEPTKCGWIERNRPSSKFASLAWSFFEIFPEAHESAFSTHTDLLSEHPDKAEKYWRGFGEGPVPAAYKEVSKRLLLPVHCIAEQDVSKTLDRLMLLKHPLHVDLASLVSQYAEKRNKFFYESCINNPGSRPCLKTFQQMHPDPFDHLNAELKDLADDETGVFQFEVQSNVPELPLTYEDLKQLPPTIEIKLRDTKTGDLREIRELSSGEQTLLALSTLMYTHKHIQPLRALYLDEIDASLHPTMIKSMLKILQEQSGDTRIYLATHSPSTVALAPEESLFFVGEGEARKIGRTEALEGLTQGFVTTEGISSVFRSLRGIDKPIIVISEGKNHEYLEPLFQKVGIDNHCHVHPYKKGRVNSKGVTELKVLHQLFCDLIDSLPNGKKLVFLVDCEQRGEIARWNNIGNPYFKVLALNEIEANPVKRGIENVVPEILLSELEAKHGKAIYVSHENPSKGIGSKDHVSRKFLDELKLVNSRIDIETLKHTLKDLIELCQNH